MKITNKSARIAALIIIVVYIIIFNVSFFQEFASTIEENVPYFWLWSFAGIFCLSLVGLRREEV